MKLFKNNLLYSSLALLILFSVTFQACDTTGSSDNVDEHRDAWGIALIMSGTEIARQFEGEVSYTDGDQLEVIAGEETPLINVQFLDEDGDTFVPEDDDYSLAWEIEPQDVFDIEQHEEDGKWAFHIVGLNGGEAQIVFQLLHLDHADFESLEFDVHVVQNV